MKQQRLHQGKGRIENQVDFDRFQVLLPSRGKSPGGSHHENGF